MIKESKGRQRSRRKKGNKEEFSQSRNVGLDMGGGGVGGFFFFFFFFFYI